MSGEESTNAVAGASESFLAPPGWVSDWRRVVLTSQAVERGLLAALPADAAEAAADLGLSAHAVRVVLDALCEFDVVERDGRRYRPGPAAPDDDTAATLAHHARVVRAWSTTLGDRLAGIEPSDAGQRTPAERERWLQALARIARERAPEVADRCLARFPEARRALDLAGGHGEHGLELTRRGLHVTLQDLPEVIELVAGWERIRRSPLELVGLDAFDGLAPGPFDLILCAGFTHTMSAGANAELLARLHGVTAPGGGVAILTFRRGRRPTAPLFAVQMLVAGGGDTYGVDDYRRWLGAAGFAEPDVVDLEGGTSLLLAARG